MACCLPFLSGILPRPTNDKLLVDVRGGDVVDTAGGVLGWFGGGATKLSDQQGAQIVEVEGPYEAHYRVWYGKGLLCFKPKSLGGSGEVPAARRFADVDDETTAAAEDATATGPPSTTVNGAATSSAETTTAIPSSNGEALAKRGHDWSKQSSVESQSHVAGRSLHNYWEERSNTTTMATPESINAPKVVQVDLGVRVWSMSTATVLYVESTPSATSSTRPPTSNQPPPSTCYPHRFTTTPTTINFFHGPLSFIMQTADQENAWAERNESKNSASSSCDTDRQDCCPGAGTTIRRASHRLDCWNNELSSRTIGDASAPDNEEADAEPFHQSFMLTKSPMPSLRRKEIGVLTNVDAPVTKPSASSGTTRFGILDRTTSAPIPCTSNTNNEGQNGGISKNSNCRRRSIFETFWESGGHRQKERLQMPPRPRGQSLDLLGKSFSSQQRPRTLPGQFASTSLRSSEEYPAALDSFLPSVPAPLERLMSRSSGVYPLFEPKSILKKEENGSVESVVRRLNQALTKISSSDGSNPAEDSATEATSASSTCKAVHFDPRVVVTEIYDPFPRRWYSDQELQKFQSNTCKLAKTYLQMHPELVPLYSKPVYDPTIKKMRRKPLFGLQGLSELDECLNDTPVKRILVVTPNEKILNLLCRSLQTIFPAAEMIRTHSGMSALEVLKRSDIDLVFCQENLSPKTCPPGELGTSSGLFSKYQREDGDKWRRTLLITLSSLMDNGQARSVVGQGATDFVWSLPPPRMTSGLQGTLAVALNKKKHGDSRPF